MSDEIILAEIERHFPRGRAPLPNSATDYWHDKEGPLFLKSGDHKVQVPDEISVWEGITIPMKAYSACRRLSVIGRGIQLTKKSLRAAFFALTRGVRSGLELVYLCLVLGLNPDDIDEKINFLKKVRPLFQNFHRVLACPTVVPLDRTTALHRAWVLTQHEIVDQEVARLWDKIAKRKTQLTADEDTDPKVQEWTEKINVLLRNRTNVRVLPKIDTAEEFLATGFGRKLIGHRDVSADTSDDPDKPGLLDRLAVDDPRDSWDRENLSSRYQYDNWLDRGAITATVHAVSIKVLEDELESEMEVRAYIRNSKIPDLARHEYPELEDVSDVRLPGRILEIVQATQLKLLGLNPEELEQVRGRANTERPE